MCKVATGEMIRLIRRQAVGQFLAGYRLLSLARSIGRLYSTIYLASAIDERHRYGPNNTIPPAEMA